MILNKHNQINSLENFDYNRTPEKRHSCVKSIKKMQFVMQLLAEN